MNRDICATYIGSYRGAFPNKSVHTYHLKRTVVQLQYTVEHLRPLCTNLVRPQLIGKYRSTYRGPF